MAATSNYEQVGITSTRSRHDKADAFAGAAYHLARARRELITGDPVELARRSNGAARGLSPAEMEARIRAFQAGNV